MNISFEMVVEEKDFTQFDSDFKERHIYFSKQWLEFLEEISGGKKLLVKIYDNKIFIGYFVGIIFTKLLCKIIGSPFYGWNTPYMGLLLSDAYTNGESRCQVVNEIIPFLASKTGAFVIRIADMNITPDEAARYINSCRIGNYSTYFLDLDKSEDELFASFSKSEVIKKIKKFEKLGCRIEHDMSDEFIDIYYDQLIEVFKKSNMKPTYSKQRIHSLFRHLVNSNMILGVKAVSPENRVIATTISIGFNTMMFQVGSASYSEYQYYYPNEALRWHSVKYWKRKGALLYDMNGIRKYKEKFRPRYHIIPDIIYVRFRFMSQTLDIFKKMYYISKSLLGKKPN